MLTMIMILDDPLSPEESEDCCRLIERALSTYLSSIDGILIQLSWSKRATV